MPSTRSNQGSFASGVTSWTPFTLVLFSTADKAFSTTLLLVRNVAGGSRKGPYQTKSMGMIWKILGHIWPIYGNGMGRLDDDMEMVWGHILPNFKLWEVYGKKTWCYPLYGRTMGISFPYLSHSNTTFPWSFLSMGIIWDIHTILFHRLPMPTDRG